MTNINFLKTTLIFHKTTGYEKCFSVVKFSQLITKGSVWGSVWKLFVRLSRLTTSLSSNDEMISSY